MKPMLTPYLVWKRPRQGRSPTLLVLAAVLVPFVVTLAGAWLSWHAAWQQAEREVGHAANIAAEYAQRLLGGLVLRIDRAQALLAGLTDAEIREREAELHQALGRGSMDPGVGPEDRQPYEFVYDRHAFPLLARNVFPVQRDTSFAFREFNQSLRDPAAASPQVSPVYVGTVTERSFFAVTMRREGTGNGLPAGSYDGVINASVYVESVEQALRRLIAGGAGQILSLVRTDGLVLARTVPVPPGTRVQPGSPMLAVIATGEESRLLTGRSTIDGVLRIVAFRRVAGYPVYTSAALDQAAVLRNWLRSLPQLLLVSVPASAALLLLALLVQRQSRALSAANERLEERVAQRTASLVESELRLRMMAREVDHRAKNALSVVVAAVRLSDRSDPDGYARAIEGRVLAMARSHDLLADKRWAGAELRALAEAELAAFLAVRGSDTDRAPRAEVLGDPLQVNAAAAQGFSMVLHELATNATKYGALSVRGGLVRVELAVDAAAQRISLRWSEAGGPPADAPGEGGFGTQVMDAIVQGQLDGEIRREWKAEGLSLTITVPLERVQLKVSEGGP